MKKGLSISALTSVLTFILVGQQQPGLAGVGEPDARFIAKLSEIVSIRERLAKSYGQTRLSRSFKAWLRRMSDERRGLPVFPKTGLRVERWSEHKQHFWKHRFVFCARRSESRWHDDVHKTAAPTPRSGSSCAARFTCTGPAWLGRWTTMMLSGELEDWLCEAGDIVVRMRAAGSPLSSREQLLYEIWLLYIQTRNGGLSQYFCNCGLAQWRRCVAAASAGGLASFHPFASRVDEIIGGAQDPYKALIERGQDADDVYYEHETSIVDELRAKCSTVG